MKWRFWSRDICLKANLNYVDQTSWMSVLEVTKKTVLSCGRRMSETKPAWKIKQPRLNKHTIALSVLHNSAYRSSVWVGHLQTTVCTIPKETTHTNMNSSKKEITSPWCTPFKWHPNRLLLKNCVGILIMIHTTSKVWSPMNDSSSQFSILKLKDFWGYFKTHRCFSQLFKPSFFWCGSLIFEPY